MYKLYSFLQEDEEEGKRTDIVKTFTRPQRQKPDEAGDRKSLSSDTQTQQEPETLVEKPSTEEPPSEEHTEPELSRLMQQTDDAKVTTFDL